MCMDRLYIKNICFGKMGISEQKYINTAGKNNDINFFLSLQ